MKHIHSYVYFFLASIAFLLQYPLIAQHEEGYAQLHNTTSHELYCATYYTSLKETKRASSIHVIAPHASLSIEQPTVKFGCQRYLCIAFEKSLLPSYMGKNLWQKSCKTAIGLLRKKTWYAMQMPSDHSLHVMSPLRWNRFIHARDIRIKQKQAPHTHTTAHVGSNESLWKEELTYIQERTPHIHKAFQELCKQQENSISVGRWDKVPRLALCLSGGGFRAMLASAGFLAGLQDAKLLDVTSYVATLSGSTWTLIPWFFEGKPISSFAHNLCSRVNHSISHHVWHCYERLQQEAEIKKAYNQEFSFVDVYGILLCDTLMSHISDNSPQEFTLSQLKEHLTPPTHPYPVFTCVMPQQNAHYDWFEVTPHVAKSVYLNSAIPLWATGRSFEKGRSTNFAPEPPLSFWLGLFGSAFCVTINEAVSRALQTIPFLMKSDHEPSFTAIAATWAHEPFFSSYIANFSYGCSWSPEKEKPSLKLIDAGHACNIPLPVLLAPERAIDIIVVLECERGKESQIWELKRAEFIAKKAGYPFPVIDYEEIAHKDVCVFEDPKHKAPTIIYIPIHKNREYDPDFDPNKTSFCNTLNFTYTQKQARKLVDLMTFVAKKHAPLITKTMIKHLR